MIALSSSLTGRRSMSFDTLMLFSGIAVSLHVAKKDIRLIETCRLRGILSVLAKRPPTLPDVDDEDKSMFSRDILNSTP